MSLSRRFLWSLVAVAVSGARAPAAGPSPVQAVSLADPVLPVSVTGNGFSTSPVLSSNGQFIAFASQASNLTTNDLAGNPRGQWLNVFVRNLATGQTKLVSVTPDGAASGNDNSYAPAVSGDGRFVVFESRASNLVTNDTNGAADIFVRDLQTGVTTLVSVNQAGTGSGNGDSSNPSITPDGRFVVFESAASDLVPNDTNGISDVFVRDLQAGATTLVSANAQSGGGSGSPAIAPDGLWVAFASTATNLVAGVTNTFGEVYVRDVIAGATLWASTNAAPIFHAVIAGSSNQLVLSYNPAMSASGGFVAFKCNTLFSDNALILRQNVQTGNTDLIATNGLFNTTFTSDDSGPAISADGRFVVYLAATSGFSGTNGYTSVYLWDAQTGTNLLVSASLDGSSPASGICSVPVLSADGRRVAFLSDASDLVTNPVDGNFHLFVRDLSAGVTQLIDVDQTGGARGNMFEGAAFSADGGLIAFDTLGDRLVANDLNTAYDVFVRNLTNGVTALVSAGDPTLPALTGNDSSLIAANGLSADGRFAVFASNATNLVAGDTNGLQDVFVYDLLGGTNVLVSANTNGMSGNGWSSLPVMSAGGRFVAFLSTATDLAPNDTNSLVDVYLRDLEAGTTTLISVNLAGMAAGVDAALPAVSADGRFVAFAAYALNMVTNNLGLNDEIYVRDLGHGTTVQVPPPVTIPAPYGNPRPLPPISLAGSLFLMAGGPLSFFYYDYPTDSIRLVRTAPLGTTVATPSVSANARFLAYQFLTTASNLVFLYDAVTGSNTLVSSSAGTSQGANSSYKLSLSDDGRYVAFVCDLSNLVTNDVNHAPDVFVADAQNPGRLMLVSVNRAGTGTGNAASDSPTISRDGRFVAFRSVATDLVAEPTDGQPNVYLRDLLMGTTMLVSGNLADTASGNGRSSTPLLSADGAVLFFNSQAPDLVTGDLNNSQDVFHLNNPVVGQAFPFLAGGQMTVIWTAVAGHVYRLQYRNSLTDTNDWTTVTGDVTANGRTASKADPAAPAAADRFYRVLLVQ